MKIKEIWKKYWRLILSILFLLIFSFIATCVVRKNLHTFDNAIYQFIIQYKNIWITNIFKIITSFSSSICLILVCICSILLFKNKKTAVLILTNLMNIVILNVVLKEIFSRPRPFELMLIEESGYSFPSGHSMASMAFYGFIIYLVANSDLNKTWKKILCISLVLLIFLIGASRVYLGVHYASDVIAGFSISIVYLLIFTHFVSRSRRKKDV